MVEVSQVFLFTSPRALRALIAPAEKMCRRQEGRRAAGMAEREAWLAENAAKRERSGGGRRHQPS
jgi:hypothetical protein